ncbi:MAG: hypothetical protein PUB52_10395 [Lachnospiraceae bacterium]|nr:hypothetical protein [Lachnospiraceae bacterium]
MGVFAITGIRQISIYMVFRSYFTYASLVFIPYATFLILQYGKGLNDKLIKLCIWIWFGVGFIQKYINSSFGYGLLSRHSTNQTRGVVGLATEPSAYGYMCVFMILLAINLRKHALFYVGMLLVQILFFAGSSVTIIYLGVYAVAFIINELCMRKKYTFVKILLLAGCAGAGIYYVRNYVSKGTRIRILVDYLFENPERFLEDGSIKRRILAITDTFGSFIEHHGMPQGLSDYKWMSGIGCMLVEGGLLSVIILVVIAMIVWRGYPRQFRIFYTLGFMVMMVSAIPFSSPIVGFYIGYCAYQGWLREQEKKNESIMDM